MFKSGSIFQATKINSPEAFKSLVTFLKKDVEKDGGAISQIVDMHGEFHDITVSASPWGPILINEEISELESKIRMAVSASELFSGDAELVED